MNFYGDTVSVLLNAGNGTLGSKVDLFTGSGPTSIAMTDLNGDSKPGLAVANLLSNSVNLFFNTCAAQ